MKWIIGLRNVKTGIAICICVIVAALLRLEYPFYAAIATIISMENSITNSFMAGKQRMMGTLVGAIVGSSVAFIDPGNAYLCALGVILVIYICNLLNWNKSVSIGCIVFLAIMLNLKDGESPFFYGFNRLTDTLIGIVIAVIVNYLVFPPKHEVSLHKARKAVARRMAQMFEQMAEKGEEANLKSLRSQLSSLEKYYHLCKFEFHLKKDLTETMDQIGEEIDSYRHIYEHLIILRRLVEENHLKLVSCGAWAAKATAKAAVETALSPGRGQAVLEGDKLGGADGLQTDSALQAGGLQEDNEQQAHNASILRAADNDAQQAGNILQAGVEESGTPGAVQASEGEENGTPGAERGARAEEIRAPGAAQLSGVAENQDYSTQGEGDVDLEKNIGIVYDYHVKWVYHEMQKLGLPIPHPDQILIVGGAE